MNLNHALVVIGNGRREYLKSAVWSAFLYLRPHPNPRIMVNDTGDREYAAYLNETYPDFDSLIHHPQNFGMAAAVQSGWKRALGNPNWDFLFHLEEDFVLRGNIPISEMMETLEANPQLASITLKRPPWAGIELTMGDQLAAICSLSEHEGWGPVTVHSHLFSLNPSLIRREVIELGWPSGPLGVGNESGMTQKLLERGYKFSVWGTVKDEPLCEHIGFQRGAEWQL